MKFSRLLFTLYLLVITPWLSQCVEDDPGSRIKHVVAVMFENRSFDHMLGFLKKLNPEIDGLTGNESNPINPQDPNSRRVKVSFDAPYDIGMNPGHSVKATSKEIWGSEKRVDPPPMDGFVYEMVPDVGDEEAGHVMQCYNSSSLVGLSTLAMEFGTFDRWYSGIPGPTEPNRLYFHSCTSHGTAHNDVSQLAIGYPQRTIYDDLYDAGKTFGIYYSDFPITTFLQRVRLYPFHIHLMSTFLEHCATGNLPNYSFLEPRWFDFLEWKENDMHPPHSTLLGEFFIKEVYEAIRASPAWNETLLIITFDEHGGLYDHVPPPQKGVPNPDGLVSKDPPFDFDRLGVRVPTVMISPWIDAKTVVHEPKKNHYDHSSLAATLRKLFKLPSPPLTKREEWSASFEDIVMHRSSPRTDCPKTLPIPPETERLWRSYKKAQDTPETEETIAAMLKRNPRHVEESPEINELQQSVLDMSWGLTGGDRDHSHIRTVHEAAVFVREQMQLWKSRQA